MSAEDLGREAQDPSTTAARLQEIAQADRSTWNAIAAHPAAYPGLLDWLAEHGDDQVRATIAARAVTPPPPPAPPAPPTPPAPPAPEPVAAPLAEQGPEPTQQLPVSEPVAQPTLTQPAATEATLPSYGAATSAPTPPADGTTGTPTVADGGSGSKKPWLGLVIVAAIVAVIAGGYFGISALTDDDDESPELASSSQRADTPEADDGDDTGADDLPSGDKGEFCSTMKELQDSNTDMLKDMGSMSDPDAFKDTFGDLADSYEDLEQSAPAELKSDVAAMRDFIDSVAEGDLSAAEGSSDKMSDYIDASTKVTTYYYSNCL